MPYFLRNALSFAMFFGVLQPLSPALAQELPIQQAVELGLDQPAAGTLTNQDFAMPDGSHADVYRLSTRAGQRYRVTLTSEAFDAYLIVYDATGGVMLSSNDDGPEMGTNAQITIDAAADGPVYIAANTLFADGLGAYAIRAHTIGDAPVAPAMQPQAGGDDAEVGVLLVDQARSGMLAEGDLQLDDESYADAYVIELSAGTTYAITMRSEAFDTYLKLVDADLEDVAVNDDAAGLGTDSRIQFTPQADGRFMVLANSLTSGLSGAYTLSLRVVDAAAPQTDRDDASVQSSVRAAALPGGGTLHAIVLGLDYTHQPSSHLLQCDDDARFIADTLRSVVPANQLDLHLLVNSQATTDNLNQSLAAVTRSIGPNDIVLIFYSGHGGQDDRPESALATEADRKPEFLALYDGLYYDHMLAQAMHGLNETNHRMTLLALDCCFAGGFNTVIDRPRRMGLFSSQEYLVSGVPREPDEYNRLFGGHLTKLLCLALQGRADGSAIDANVPADGNVTVIEIEKYIRSEWKPVVIDGQYQEPVFVRPAVDPSTVLVATASASHSIARSNSSVDLVFRERSIAAGQVYYSSDFQGVAGQRYLLETSDLTGGLDTVIKLLGSTDPDNASDNDPVMAENDDANDNTRASRLEWQCPADGMYYVAIRGFDNSAGQFTFRIQEIGGQPQAPALSVLLTDFTVDPQVPVHTEDYDLIAGRSYRIRTLDLSDDCDTVIQLRRSTNPEYADDADPVIAENDDGRDTGLASDLTWTCTESGKYYVTVRGFGKTSGTFSLSVDEVVGGNALQVDAGAIALPLPAAAQVHLQSEVELTGQTPRHFGDYQWNAGQNLVIETYGLSEGCDTVIEVRRSTNPEAAQDDDPVIATNDDAGGTLASRIECQIPQTGAYYITVRAYEGKDGTCGLVIRDAIESREIFTSVILELGDGDAHNQGDYRIERGRRLMIETFDLSEGCDTYLEIRRSTDPEAASPDDPILATNDDAEGLASRIHWVCPEDGDYYIKLTTLEGKPGTCRLRISYGR